MCPQNTHQIDFLIVTPLREERDAVLARLPRFKKLPPSPDSVHIYFTSELPVTFADGSAGIYRIGVLPLTGMGRVKATAATGDAIRRFSPRFVILTGIAGGIAAQGVMLGDVLIADKVVDYELQKLTRKGPQIRWEVYNADPRLLGAAQNLLGNEWQKRITQKRPEDGAPQTRFGPVATGDKVVAFARALAKYRETWSKLIGVEMEAGGVALSAFQAADPPGFFMARGVSDLADEDKDSETVGRWRSYACDVAAAYVVAWLESGPAPLCAPAPTLPDRVALVGIPEDLDIPLDEHDVWLKRLDEADLDNLVLNRIPELYAKFGRGWGKIDKINKILEYVHLNPDAARKLLSVPKR